MKILISSQRLDQIQMILNTNPEVRKGVVRRRASIDQELEVPAEDNEKVGVEEIVSESKNVF